MLVWLFGGSISNYNNDGAVLGSLDITPVEEKLRDAVNNGRKQNSLLISDYTYMLLVGDNYIEEGNLSWL